jgi:TonB-linked SusC/RagA family outer membrane protein
MTKYQLIAMMKHFWIAGMLMAATTLSAQEEEKDFFHINVLHVTLYEAEEVEVSGIITDAATGRPLMGAQVKVAGTDLSAISDDEGLYTIKAPTAKEVLIIGMPDYALREAPLQGRIAVNISLYRDIFTSGYGNMETLSGVQRKTLTLSAAETAAGFSLSTAIAPEAEIQARLGADVRAITRSGTTGSGAALFLRGFNSLNANAQPLFIVDGVIWDNQLNNSSIHLGFFSNPLANIDMKDVESITVLKDGNSIYGSKAANGVILINTVRGKDMTTRITANASWGVNTQPRLPRMMNASQYRLYASNQVKYLMQQYDIPQSLLSANFPFMEEPSKRLKDYDNDTDWSDVVYQDGTVQSYSLNVNGGDEIALYNLSLGYTGSEGTVKNTSMERFTARFNSDIQMFKNLFTKIDLSIAQTSRDIRDQGVNLIASPEYIALAKAPILAPYGYLPNGQPSPNLAVYDVVDSYMPVSNPLALIDNAIGTASRIGFKLKANPYWQPLNNLKIGTTFSYGLDRVKESFFIPSMGVAPWKIENTNYYAENEVRDYTQRQISLFSDTRIDWNVNLTEDNHLALLGGFRILSDTYESDLPRGYNTGNDNIKVLVDKHYTSPDIAGVNDEWISLSWYADATYDYQKKYFLNLTASADASSRFGKRTQGGITAFGQPWGVFPSVAGVWLISSEEFMQNVSAVNLLKLRASYGLTGNDDIDANAGRSYFVPVKWSTTLAGLALGNIQNEEIQWETSKKAGAGLDIHLFDERLALSFDLFSATTDNLLTLKELSYLSGLDYYWSNGGQLKNRGYEVSMDVKLLNFRQLKWDLGASIGHYKNEITALPDGDYDTQILGATVRTAVGQPAGVFYGYKTQGVFATSEEAAEAGLYKLNEDTKKSYYGAGDVRFANLYNENGDHEINEKDRTVIGDPNPDFYGTITNRLKFGRFNLDVLFNYSYGNEVYNYLRSQLESGSGLYNQTVAMTNRWTTEGQRTSTPKAVYGDPQGNSVFSDRWIEDGSFLRLKTVTLSYSIPFNFPYLQGITIWASANNLWTWTNYLGNDPESSMNNTVLSQGIDAGLTPQNRSYYVGLKINL